MFEVIFFSAFWKITEEGFCKSTNKTNLALSTLTKVEIKQTIFDYKG